MTPDQLQRALVDYLTRHHHEQSETSLGPLVALSGGWASDLYTFTLQQAGSGGGPAKRLVLKMYAPDARGRQHATRE